MSVDVAAHSFVMVLIEEHSLKPRSKAATHAKVREYLSRLLPAPAVSEGVFGTRWFAVSTYTGEANN
jgi:hypothetical protein